MKRDAAKMVAGAFVLLLMLCGAAAALAVVVSLWRAALA